MAEQAGRQVKDRTEAHTTRNGTEDRGLNRLGLSNRSAFELFRSSALRVSRVLNLGLVNPLDVR